MKQLLAELFEKYYRDIYTYLYGLCHDAVLSEDLTSEVFLEAVKSIASFRGDSDIKTWLFSIARHKWYGWLRKKHRQIQTQSIHDLWDRSEYATSDKNVDDEVNHLVNDMLSDESELTQKVFQMRLEGYSYYEIASQIQISENSTRVIFFRVKTKLKKLLEKEGFRYG